jgi:hypothetical protein
MSSLTAETARDIRKRKRSDSKEANLIVYNLNKIAKLIIRSKGPIIVERPYEYNYDLMTDYCKYKQQKLSNLRFLLACFICSRGTSYVYHKDYVHKGYFLKTDNEIKRCFLYEHEDCIEKYIKTLIVITKYVIMQIWLMDTYFAIHLNKAFQYYLTWIPEEVLEVLTFFFEK